MVTTPTVRYEVSEGTATIMFNRPEQLNAVRPLMIRELQELLQARGQRMRAI